MCVCSVCVCNPIILDWLTEVLLNFFGGWSGDGHLLPKGLKTPASEWKQQQQPDNSQTSVGHFLGSFCRYEREEKIFSTRTTTKVHISQSTHQLRVGFLHRRCCCWWCLLRRFLLSSTYDDVICCEIIAMFMCVEKDFFIYLFLTLFAYTNVVQDSRKWSICCQNLGFKCKFK